MTKQLVKNLLLIVPMILHCLFGCRSQLTNIFKPIFAGVKMCDWVDYYTVGLWVLHLRRP